MDVVEFNDWEVLDHSTSTHTTTYLEGIERDSEGIIKSDYFSLDSTSKYPKSPVEDVTDQISVESDNPSWIDPVCDTNYSKTKPIGENWSTDGSDDGKYVESDASNGELGGEIVSRKLDYDHDDDDGESLSDSGDGVKSVGDEGGKRVGVWWKLPVDLLKYCLFKASPVWTISVAAAMMGVVILGRRLYKMKRKTRSLQLKLTIDDDKKVSQVMSRAARLNEAFSIVKRAPLIRPSLPGTGIAPWPVMALR